MADDGCWEVEGQDGAVLPVGTTSDGNPMMFRLEALPLPSGRSTVLRSLMVITLSCELYLVQCNGES